MPTESDQIRSNVLKAIDEIMMEEDLSASDVAARIQTHVNRISEWKKGKGNPTVMNLVPSDSQKLL